MPYKTSEFYLKAKKFKGKTFRDRNKLEKLIGLACTKRYSASILAKIFRCNRKTVLYTLYCKGIILPNQGRFKKVYTHNPKFFTTLNSTSAYWAGFIAADGCLYARDHGLIIGIKEADIMHLQKFARAIKTDAKIRHIKSNKSVHIGIYSRRIFDSLSNLGLKPNKSLRLGKVRIPTNLLSHFIRGVFDGDGSLSGNDVSHIQFSIIGYRDFLKWIQDILVDACHVNKVSIYTLKSRAFKLQYTGSQIFEIMSFLYKGATPQTRLERKYQKYLALKKKFM